LVTFAVILQQVGYQGVSFMPCPLCILQRVGYLSIATCCLLAAGLPATRKWFHGLAIIAAAYGTVVAGKQVWLLSHPEISCGIDPLETWINQFQLVQLIPWLFKADGLCSAKLPSILGLQVPEWSLVSFVTLLLYLLLTFFKKQNKTIS
jgi:disulfide bond formation protein DsbB